ncbi:MAG: tetratricopeptide repeat protein [Gammaproteobacteria bacterium]|nr:tetratricopeptide repeat protein [Gammaproteobacteria bacterium]
MRDDYAEAMEQLLEIVRRDQNFRDHAGRQDLPVLFALFGENDPRVMRFREQLCLALG